LGGGYKGEECLKIEMLTQGVKKNGMKKALAVNSEKENCPTIKKVSKGETRSSVTCLFCGENEKRSLIH